MINMNEMMKKVVTESGIDTNEIEIDSIVNKIVDNTRVINDCIIYDEKGVIKEENINFDRIKKIVGDWTGYEVGCNELRFNLRLIKTQYLLAFANYLHKILNKEYAPKAIVVYVTLYGDEVEVRFHTKRENEGFWLDSDLSKYDVPILYIV